MVGRKLEFPSDLFNTLALDAKAVEPKTFYHNGSDKRARSLSAKRVKAFIFWDGEGATEDKERPQHYVLFGNSAEEATPLISPNLNTKEMLAYILHIGRKYPKAWHVGFAFGYDVNMILRNLSLRQFKELRDTGSVFAYHYRIEHVPGKWLRVTDYNDTADRFTVTITDIFGFFQCSFVKALHDYIPDHHLMRDLEIVESGKAQRSSFQYKDLPYILRYWQTEIKLGQALIEKLRELLYNVGLYVSQWHGPGALASYAFKKQGVRKHLTQPNPVVYDAARYAYAGGRFELFRVGRHENVYSLDINSAYPYGISQLPSLTEGNWVHKSPVPTSLAEFGLYHVELRGSPLTRQPSPLFCRDSRGNISYPWITKGWYWSPEVKLLQEFVNPRQYIITESWEYEGWDTKPFSFVLDMYAQRRDLKAAKVASERALKLCLNSLYGKMAQRVGWERTNGPPIWHALDWAGWVTSNTRAMLFRLIHEIPWQELIAVETDGLYTTATPQALGISDSKELGGWEVKAIDEMYYAQSGLYAARADGEWNVKYRGMDKGTITVDSLRQHMFNLVPNAEWPSIDGFTTRFIGYRQALYRQQHHMGPFYSHHRRWETEDKSISSGRVGKRRHSPKLCIACRAGANAYDMPHCLVAKPANLNDRDSYPHDIPWLGEDTAEWREYEAGHYG